MPQISIIVPCYNQAQYLPEALQSVSDQSFSDWECIIVNDGSPDNTESVAKEWCNNDSRFKYLKKENGGLSSARNAGINMAKGEWILPLDADDKIGKDYLKLTIDVMATQPEPGIIYCKADYFGIKDGTWNLEPFDKRNFLIRNQIFCTAFFKKEDWSKVGGYDVNFRNGREDWEFWINLLKTTQKEVIRLDYTGFFYRIKERSMITEFISDKDKILDTEIKIYEKHKDIYSQYFGSYISLLNHNNQMEKENEILITQIKYIQNKISYRILKKISSIFKIKII